MLASIHWNYIFCPSQFDHFFDNLTSSCSLLETVKWHYLYNVSTFFGLTKTSRMSKCFIIFHVLFYMYLSSWDFLIFLVRVLHFYSSFCDYFYYINYILIIILLIYLFNYILFATLPVHKLNKTPYFKFSYLMEAVCFHYILLWSIFQPKVIFLCAMFYVKLFMLF